MTGVFDPLYLAEVWVAIQKIKETADFILPRHDLSIGKRKSVTWMFPVNENQPLSAGYCSRHLNEVSVFYKMV